MPERLCAMCAGRRRLASGQECPLCSAPGQGRRSPERSGRRSYFSFGILAIVAVALTFALVVRACVARV